jgi:dienelactone hydrolase
MLTANFAGRSRRCLSLGVFLLLVAGWSIFACGQGSAYAGFGLPSAKETAGTFQFDGKTINYWQFEPKDKDKDKAKPKDPLPAILVVHGIEGLESFHNKTGKDYKLFCGMIASYGYVVHFVHYLDCTPTDCWPHATRRAVRRLQNRIKDTLTTPPGKEDEEVAGKFKTWMSCVHAGLENLRAQKGKVDKQRIGVVGLSMGGFLTTSLAVTEPDKFHPQAMIVAFGGLPPRLHGAKLGKMPPVCIIAGTKDEIVPLQLMQDTRQCLEANKGVVQFKTFDCHHMFTDAKGDFQLSVALQAQEFARSFLEQYVQKAK